MTAPVVPSPSAPAAPEGGFDFNSLAGDIVSSAVASVAPDSPDQPRDDKGRFVSAAPVVPASAPADGQQQPASTDSVATAPEAGADPAADPAPVELPEGFVASKGIEGRDLATQFAVTTPDGEEVEIPDLRITLRANGQDRAEPLDRVVKFAQIGMGRDAAREKYDAVQRNADTQSIQNQNLIATIQQMQQDRERLLSDDNHYLTQRAQHEQQNTPEAKAQRAQSELAFMQAANAGERFYQQHVAPGVQQIVDALPEVTRDEIEARVLLLNQRFLVATPYGSVIDPRAHGLVAQSLVSDIIPWAHALHTERAATKGDDPAPRATGTPAVPQPSVKPKSPPESEKVKALQAEAQKARNLNTRGQRPSRNTGTAPLRDIPKPKPITNVDDAMSSALDDTFAALGLRRPGGS
jgi:hypothetical protein